MKLGLYILTLATWISYTILGLALFNFYRVRNVGWCGTPEATAEGYIILSSLIVIPLLLSVAIISFIKRKELSRSGKIWSIVTVSIGGLLYLMWPIIPVLKTL